MQAVVPIIYETQEALDADLKIWQERLSLQPYIIDAKIVRDREIDARGMARVYVDQLCGAIRLQASIDFDPDEIKPGGGHRAILIHELLHFVLEPLHLLTAEWSDEIRRRPLEQAINQIERCISGLVAEIEAHQAAAQSRK